MYNFNLYSRYTFNTKAPGVLGATITNAKVIGTVGYDMAVTIDNIDYLHRTIYPLLPEGSPSDAKAYTYIVYISQNGQKSVIAYEWIDDTTIVENGSTTLNVTLQDTSIDKIDQLRQTLVMLGFTNITIDAQ